MSRLVLDCSVAMSWCFEDEADAYSDGVLSTLPAAEALVPAIWPLEVVNVLVAAERRRRLSEADSARFVELLGGLPIFVEDLPFARAAGPVLGLARRVGLSSYDAAYLELAMRSGLPLATRDDRLRRAARACGTALFGA